MHIKDSMPRFPRFFDNLSKLHAQQIAKMIVPLLFVQIEEVKIGLEAPL